MKKVLALIITVVSLVSCGDKSKTAWINGQQVYDEYELTKERQESFLKQRDNKRQVLDSLKNKIIAIENDLRIIENPPKNRVEKYQSLVSVFRQQQEKFEKENQDLSNQYRDEIFKKLYDEVEEYAKANGYQYIFADWGNTGNIMYADESKDITKAMIEYLNGKE